MASDKNGGLIAEAIFPRPKMGHLGLNVGPKLSLSTERKNGLQGIGMTYQKLGGSGRQ